MRQVSGKVGLTVNAADHGLRGYRRGCRCEPCVEANRAYMAAWRARKRGLEPVPAEDTGPALTVVPAAHGAPVAGVGGSVVAAVLAELETLAATASRPGLAAGAVSMAKILDDRKLSTTHPSAQRQLAQTLDRLRNASHTAKGKLASVIDMSPAKPS